MDTSSSYHLLSSLNASFQKLITTYNNQEASPVVKTQSLEKMNALVQSVLKAFASQKVAQEIKNFLKKIKVRLEDKNLWNQIMNKIEKASPTDIRYIEMLQAVPMDIYSQIIEKLEDIELLNLFSPDLSPEQRFQLALQCGEELTTLDLSKFQGLDNEKLKTLQQTCPNLRSLDLSDTPIEKLDLSILKFFFKARKA